MKAHVDLASRGRYQHPMRIVGRVLAFANLMLLRKMAGAGWSCAAVAQYNLGLMYANGRGVPKDDAEAVKWLRKAAEKGVDESQYNLGLMYANGRGVPKDDATAYQWYLLAVAQGNEEARKGMDDMEKLLTPEQRAEGQRMAREFKAKESK